jgi:plasmid stabilization system protein ParE
MASSGSRSTPSQSRTEVAIDAAQEAVRASIEAASKVARASLEAGTEAARKVQDSLKTALEALAPEAGAGRSPGSKGGSSTAR